MRVDGSLVHDDGNAGWTSLRQKVLLGKGRERGIVGLMHGPRPWPEQLFSAIYDPAAGGPAWQMTLEHAVRQYQLHTNETLLMRALSHAHSEFQGSRGIIARYIASMIMSSLQQDHDNGFGCIPKGLLAKLKSEVAAFLHEIDPNSHPLQTL